MPPEGYNEFKLNRLSEETILKFKEVEKEIKVSDQKTEDQEIGDSSKIMKKGRQGMSGKGKKRNN